jgi:hypothetical protein
MRANPIWQEYQKQKVIKFYLKELAGLGRPAMKLYLKKLKGQ